MLKCTKYSWILINVKKTDELLILYSKFNFKILIKKSSYIYNFMIVVFYIDAKLKLKISWFFNANFNKMSYLHKGKSL